MAELIKKTTDSSYSDLYTTYGIRLVKGAYDELIKYPPMKAYISNNSRLENGVRYVVKSTNPKYDEKSFSIEFVLFASSQSAFYTNLEAFLAKITGDVFELKITSLNKVFRLVYTDCQRLQTYKKKWATFELSLIEPDPTNRSEDTEEDETTQET